MRRSAWVSAWSWWLGSGLGLGSAVAEARGFEDHELGDFYRLAEVDDDVVLAASEAVIRFPTATGFLLDPDGGGSATTPSRP